MNHPIVKKLIQRTKKLNVPLNAFCKEIGVSYSLMSKIFSGDRPNPTINTITKWERALSKAERKGGAKSR